MSKNACQGKMKQIKALDNLDKIAPQAKCCESMRSGITGVGNRYRKENPMPNATLEQRMTAIEKTVRELQEAMNAHKPAADWLDHVIGSLKDEPAFDEVLASGRTIRQSDRPAEDQTP